MIEYQNLTEVAQLEQLLGKVSRHGDFVYRYDSETIDLLKRYFFESDSLFILANDEAGRFAGFVSCDRDWWEEGCFFLREIFVNPEHQGQGIGGHLMARCIAHAKNHDAKALVTQTAFANIPMQQLCEGFGFTRYENPKWTAGITYKLTL